MCRESSVREFKPAQFESLDQLPRGLPLRQGFDLQDALRVADRELLKRQPIRQMQSTPGKGRMQDGGHGEQSSSKTDGPSTASHGSQVDDLTNKWI